MTSSTGKIVNQYMSRLGEELRDIPRARREELMTEIRDHIEEAQDEQDAWDEAGIRNVLDRIGDPADIGAEARERFGVQPRGMGTQEIFAVLMLTIGGLILPLIGWLIGFALMWGSRAWTRTDKWVGTLLFPGGMTLAFLLVSGSIGMYTCAGDGATEVCEGEPSDLMFAVYMFIVALSVLGTIFSGIYLSRRARRRAGIAAY